MWPFAKLHRLTQKCDELLDENEVLRFDKKGCQQEIAAQQTVIADLKQQIKALNGTISAKDKKRNELRAEYNELYNKSVELQDEVKILNSLNKDLNGAYDRQSIQFGQYKAAAYKVMTNKQWALFEKVQKEVAAEQAKATLEAPTHFYFPKIGLTVDQVWNDKDGPKSRRYRLTGLTHKDGGLTQAEGAEIVEYLSKFPENVHKMESRVPV